MSNYSSDYNPAEVISGSETRSIKSFGVNASMKQAVNDYGDAS